MAIIRSAGIWRGNRFEKGTVSSFSACSGRGSNQRGRQTCLWCPHVCRRSGTWWDLQTEVQPQTRSSRHIRRSTLHPRPSRLPEASGRAPDFPHVILLRPTRSFQDRWELLFPSDSHRRESSEVRRVSKVTPVVLQADFQDGLRTPTPQHTCCGQHNGMPLSYNIT